MVSHPRSAHLFVAGDPLGHLPPLEASTIPISPMTRSSGSKAGFATGTMDRPLYPFDMYTLTIKNSPDKEDLFIPMALFITRIP
jgi:hypothetical protein